MADPATLRKNITKGEVSSPIRYRNNEESLEPEELSFDYLFDYLADSKRLFYYPLLRIASEQTIDGVRVRVTLGQDGTHWHLVLALESYPDRYLTDFTGTWSVAPLVTEAGTISFVINDRSYSFQEVTTTPNGLQARLSGLLLGSEAWGLTYSEVFQAMSEPKLESSREQ